MTSQFCKVCSKKTIINLNYSGVSYCKNCFERILFKRVSAFIRKNDLLDYDKELILVDDSSTVFHFLKKFFKVRFGKTPLKVRVVKRVTKTLKGKVIVENITLTFVSSNFLKAVFENNPDFLFFPKIKQGSNIIIRPLLRVSDDDLVKWAKSFRIPIMFIELGSEKDFLDFVKETRPMAEFSFLKFIENLE